MQFTVITETRVLRVKAKGYKHLTTALDAVGIEYLGIEADKEESK
jgi:hypothetical protein